MSDDATTNAKWIADLKQVLEVTRQLGATVELNLLLERIVAAATTVLDCERATVFILDRATRELFSRVATGTQEIRFSVERGIAGEVARTGKAINVADAYNDPRFNPEIDRKTGFHTRNILTCPLWDHDNEVVGVLQVLNKRGGPFDARDEELANYLGAQAGVAVQRQFLLEELAVKQRIQRDLNLAREIQQGLLPEKNPEVAGFDVAGWNKPADETGGDCYDFMTTSDGHLAMTIADATGHGIGPALVIAETRALFRATISRTQELPLVVTQLNRLLHDDLPDDRFVTAFFGLLIPEQNRIAFISAGHGPILVFRAATGAFSEVPSHGLPLGILEDAEYDKPNEINLDPGDMLVLLTDGFFEWPRDDGEQYGTERMFELIRANREKPAAQLIEMVYHSVLAFAPGTPQRDDLTAVIVKRT